MRREEASGISGFIVFVIVLALLGAVLDTCSPRQKGYDDTGYAPISEY